VDIDGDIKVVNGVIYVASYQGNLAAISLKSSKLIWQHKLSTYHSIAVGDKIIIATDAESRIWAFDRATGSVKWKQDKLSGRQITAPTLIGNAVAVGDDQGYVHLVSLHDGHFLARSRIAKRAILTKPIAQGKNLYVYSASGYLMKVFVPIA